MLRWGRSGGRMASGEAACLSHDAGSVKVCVWNAARLCAEFKFKIINA